MDEEATFGGPQPGEPVQPDPSLTPEQQLFARVNASFLGGARFEPAKMSALEWNGKIEPKIRPDMSAKQVREQLKQAEGNGHVVRFARDMVSPRRGSGGPASKSK